VGFNLAAPQTYRSSIGKRVPRHHFNPDAKPILQRVREMWRKQAILGVVPWHRGVTSLRRHAKLLLPAGPGRRGGVGLDHLSPSMQPTKSTESANLAAVIERDDLQALLDALAKRGYPIIGPTVRDGAIVLDTVTAVSDLPVGWTDEQAPGRYRLVERDDDAVFSFVCGPEAWKKYLHPPTVPPLAGRAGRDGLPLHGAPGGACQDRTSRCSRHVTSPPSLSRTRSSRRAPSSSRATRADEPACSSWR